MTIKISLKNYQNEIDRKMRPYGGLSVKKIALYTAVVLASGLFLYSLNKSDAARIQDACEKANSYLAGALNDSNHGKELAKNGLHEIEKCEADLDLVTFASTKKLNQLEKNLENLAEK